MKKGLFFLAFSLLSQAAPAQSLYDHFADPPQEARPRVWWHWMDGNISMDGITKDIEWMDRVGIGGFHQFDAGGIGMRPIVDETMPYNSPQWKVAIRYAMDLAAAKGMETAVASAPGWSSLMGFALIMLLDQQYHVTLSVEDFMKIETVAELARAAGVDA